MNKDRLSDQFFSSYDEDDDSVDDRWESHLGKKNRMTSNDRRSKKKIRKFHKDS